VWIRREGRTSRTLEIDEGSGGGGSAILQGHGRLDEIVGGEKELPI